VIGSPSYRRPRCDRPAILAIADRMVADVNGLVSVSRSELMWSQCHTLQPHPNHSDNDEMLGGSVYLFDSVTLRGVDPVREGNRGVIGGPYVDGVTATFCLGLIFLR
jgi:hypothetical protein